jgi:hypothetical protein
MGKTDSGVSYGEADTSLEYECFLHE